MLYQIFQGNLLPLLIFVSIGGIPLEAVAQVTANRSLDRKFADVRPLSSKTLGDSTSTSEISSKQKLDGNLIVQVSPSFKIPNPITPRSPKKRPPQIPPHPLDDVLEQPEPSPEEESDTERETRREDLIEITIAGFEFEGNTVFEDRELAAAIAATVCNYNENRNEDEAISIGTRQSEFGCTDDEIENIARGDQPLQLVIREFAQLLEIEEAVRQKYIGGCNDSNSETPCYINSGAVIPANPIHEPDEDRVSGTTICPANQELDPNGATICVQIIEGRLEGVKVTVVEYVEEDSGRMENTEEGSERTEDTEERAEPTEVVIENPGLKDYVESRLMSLTEGILNRDELLEALRLLQLDPLIERISAELSESPRFGFSLLEVTVVEAETSDLELFADNGRAPSVGTFRRGIRFNQSSFLETGDFLDVAYTNTDGSNELDASYTIPINSRNGTLRLAGGVTETDVVEPPFDRLDIEGDSRYFEVSLRQPVILTPSSELALGLTVSRQESETTLLGDRFPLSAGANDDGETRISALRFFQDWVGRGERDVLALRSQFSLGLGALDATVNNERPDSEFFAWRGQVQYVRCLGEPCPDTVLWVLRSDVQLANDALLPLEQFGIGGLQSVRGYRQDALLTDNGALASMELRIPVWRVFDVDGVLLLAPFFEVGVGWNSRGNPNPDPQTLVGAGVGLLWEMGDDFTARFDWGIPLVEVDSRDRTLQEQGLYFSVNFHPF